MEIERCNTLVKKAMLNWTLLWCRHVQGSKENFKRERTRGLIICERETERGRERGVVYLLRALPRLIELKALQQCLHKNVTTTPATIQPYNQSTSGPLVTLRPYRTVSGDSHSGRLPNLWHGASEAIVLNNGKEKLMLNKAGFLSCPSCLFVEFQWSCLDPRT